MSFIHNNLDKYTVKQLCSVICGVRDCVSVVVKNYNHKANRGKVPDDKKNLLNRDFKAETMNQKWFTDITSIHVRKEGWTYLASVMDLYDRKIIGYAYGKNMTADLALEAVKNACLNVTKSIFTPTKTLKNAARHSLNI